jgi:general secretion pathway protein F
MPVFEYTALTSAGKNVKGLIEADNVRVARTKLKKEGTFPTTLTESIEKNSLTTNKFNFSFLGGRINAQQLAIATRQLSTLVGAGIPLVESLKALSEQLENPKLKKVISNISEKVNEGANLADTLEEYPKVFPRLYANMIASGEASGSLDLVLERLAELMEGQADLKRKVLTASAYPVLMLILCFGVLILLLAYVVPEITAIFKDQKATLPVATKIVIAISDFVKSFWLFLVVLAGIASLGLRHYSQTPQGRRKIDGLLLTLPLVSNVSIRVATARFSRTLGTMLNSGIPLLKALGIVKNIVGNVLLEEVVENAIEGVREGKSLASELSKGNLFPKLLVHMVATGERTGQLEPMLLRIARSYELEVDATISGLTKILEPLLIVFLATIVGGILASIMLPMLEISSLATG